jgi:hypothetical protein
MTEDTQEIDKIEKLIEELEDEVPKVRKEAIEIHS